MTQKMDHAESPKRLIPKRQVPSMSFSTMVANTNLGEQAVLQASASLQPMQPISLSLKPSFTQMESWRCARAIVDIMEHFEGETEHLKFFDFNAGSGQVGELLVEQGFSQVYG